MLSSLLKSGSSLAWSKFMAIVSHSTVSSVQFDSDDKVSRFVNNFTFNSKLERPRGTDAGKSLSRCYFARG